MLTTAFQQQQPRRPVTQVSPEQGPPPAPPAVPAQPAEASSAVAALEAEKAAKPSVAPDPAVTDLQAQVRNLRDEMERQAGRIAKLEASAQPSQSATPAAPEPIVVTLPNPGEQVKLFAEGPHAGKLLRVEKGQKLSGPAAAGERQGFRDEYALSDSDWDFWLKEQLPALLKETPENFSHESWKPHTQK